MEPMFASARKALGMIFDPAFFRVVLISIVLTLVLFVALFAGAEYGVTQLPTLGAHWVNVALEIVTPVLGVLLIVALGAPVAALFASFFLDRVAGAVERKYYPADPKASGAPVISSLFLALRFTGLILAVTVALLPFDVILPGVGSAVTLVADAWLLGREYFELAALRHMSKGAVDEMRKRHRFAILGAGLAIALLSLIPGADLIAPLFGAGLMVHVFKFYQHQERLA
jgi:CysZ protein